MKIDIKTDEGKRILLWLPTRLILNRLTAGIAVAFLNKENRKNGDPKLTVRQFMPLVREIHRQRRIQGRKWVLVDVESGSGEKVKIKL